jgi:dihydrofolate reductase
MLVLIAAMSLNRVIGFNNQLPWLLSADFQYFKAITSGQTVVMGRRTYESIGHPLAGRRNIVLSRRPNFKAAPNTEVVRSISAILKLATAQIVFVIGGALVYRQFIPYAGRIYLTLIEAVFVGDVFFPELDATWKLVSRTGGVQDAANPFPHWFLIYEKTNYSLIDLRVFI